MISCDSCKKTLGPGFLCQECLKSEIDFKKQEYKNLWSERKKLVASMKNLLVQNEKKENREYFLTKKRNLLNFLKQKARLMEIEIKSVRLKNKELKEQVSKRRFLLAKSREKLTKYEDERSARIEKARVVKYRFEKSYLHFVSTKRRILEFILSHLPIARTLSGSRRETSIYVEDRVYIFSKHLFLTLKSRIDVKNPLLGSALGYIVLFLEVFSWYANIWLPHKMVYRGERSAIRRSEDHEYFKLYPSKSISVGLELLSENVEMLCTLCGFSIVKRNRKNFRVNLLSLAHVDFSKLFSSIENFTYYTATNSKIVEKTPNLLIRNDDLVENYYVRQHKYAEYINLDNLGDHHVGGTIGPGGKMMMKTRANKQLKYAKGGRGVVLRYGKTHHHQRSETVWPDGYRVRARGYLETYLDELVRK